MKIIVDEMPNTPKECLFAERNVEIGYVCSLRGLNPDGKRTRCICKPENCDRLTTLSKKT